ncbi:NfeD family protein [Pseudomonas putida]|uniref:NfeD family protein n=1 Tax=Pseudomonas putida TaxID=303 RepID=UPI0023640D7A|nr:NfeD family protein [Pseudomonas putida]MDD2052856.1 NfeD family protein [Pseudomonas putida]
MGSLVHNLPYYWLALGALLLTLEMFGTGFYLLWIGIAALVVGVLGFIAPWLPWPLQCLLFAGLSLVTTVLWWKRQRRVNKTSAQPALNMRGQELVGRVFLVNQAIVNGSGKIKAGDTVWMVTGPDTDIGAQVRVVGQNGTILKVESVD